MTTAVMAAATMTERRTEAARAAAAGDASAAAPPDAVARAPRRPARSQKPVVLAYAGSALGFAAVLGALSFQVAAGRDPAIGAGEQAAASPAKRVLVRRIVRRVIVTREARDPAPASAAPAAAPAAPSTAAPAPAPAPAVAAPAPAPAPPTTRSS
jgi:hypothetical protein